jgi:Domain of unknown function (DUF4347)
MDILRSSAQTTSALEKSLLNTAGAVGATPSILEYPAKSGNHSSRGAIAFVDSGLADYQQMVDAMGQDSIEVIVLDRGGDAIAQMTQVLSGRQNIQAIHILSHGTQGGLKLGESWLDLQTLPSYVSQIQTWGQSLSADADILLYGCNVAQNSAGRGFMSLLSQLTGADVTASNDITGINSNWQLEETTGAIEAAQLAFEQYQYNLATFKVTVAGDSGVGSLRDAIDRANNTVGKDVIEFDATAFTTPKTIKLLTSQLIIKDSIEIKGLGPNLITVSGDKDDDSVNDAGDNRIFFIQSGDVAISNLTLSNGRAQGRDGGRGGAGAGLGGAIYVDGYDEFGVAKTTNLTIDNVIFSNNLAFGGSAISGNAVLGGVGFSEFALGPLLGQTSGDMSDGGIGGAGGPSHTAGATQGQAGSASLAPGIPASQGGAAGKGGSQGSNGGAGVNGGGGGGGGGGYLSGTSGTSGFTGGVGGTATYGYQGGQGGTGGTGGKGGSGNGGSGGQGGDGGGGGFGNGGGFGGVGGTGGAGQLSSSVGGTGGTGGNAGSGGNGGFGSGGGFGGTGGTGGVGGNGIGTTAAGGTGGTGGRAGTGGKGGFGGGGGAGGEGGKGGTGGTGATPGADGRVGIAGTAGLGGFGGGAGSATVGGGGAGFGGAIFIRSGTVTVRQSSFVSNKTQGGTGANSGDGKGGAIFVNDGAKLYYQSLTFNQNTANTAGTGESDNSNIFITETATYREIPKLTLPATASIDENLAGFVANLSTTQAAGAVINFEIQGDSRFEVVNNQLKLKQGVTLDYEKVKSLALSITARDTIVPSLSDTKSITVNVNDINEAPTLSVNANIELAENVLGVVVSDWSLSDPEDAVENITYEIKRNGAIDDRFEVKNGKLKLKDEVAFNFESEPSLTLSITATDSGKPNLNGAGKLSDTKTIAITVKDINEKPTMTLDAKTSLDENIKGGDFAAIAVVDPETDTIDYTFKIGDKTDDRFEVKNGRVKLKDGVAFNYEAESQFTLTVIATDRGKPNLNGVGALSDQKDVVVQVKDINEKPTMTLATQATLAENILGGEIASLTVVDPEDASADITYEIYNNNNLDTRFVVKDGKLKLVDDVAFNYEAESSLTLTVVASDTGKPNAQGTGVLVDTKTIAVSVKDINEKPTLTLNSTAEVAENSLGAVLSSISVSDPEDLSSAILYEIRRDGVVDNRFVIEDGQLKLVQTAAFDYEKEQSITLVVKAIDTGKPNLNGAGRLDDTKEIVVAIKDINEKPVLTMASQVTIAENATGAELSAVTVVDPEKDTITYEVRNGQAIDDRFEVKAGKLKLKDDVSFDFETEPSLTLTVTATDNGKPNLDGVGKLDDTQTIAVTVKDINEKPVLTLDAQASLDENIKGGDFAAIAVTDPEKDAIAYTFKIGDKVDDRFEIKSGRLKLKDGVAFDFEKEAQFTLSVMATDTGKPSTDGTGKLSDQKDILVKVNNLNEKPTLTIASSATVVENEAGAILSDWSWSDPEDSAPDLSYTIRRNGEIDTRFEYQDGKLKLKAGESLDFEKEQSLVLEVTATDTGKPLGASSALTDVKTITLTVTDINESPVLKLDAQVLVDEGAKGVELSVISVADPEQDNINYSFMVGDEVDDRFEVKNGKLKLKDDVSFNFETESQLVLTVVATDSGKSGIPGTALMSDRKDIAISINNVNEPRSEILFQNSRTGEVALWAVDHQGNLTGAKFVTFNGQILRVSADWKALDTGDVNQDGIVDILWFNSKTQETAIHFMDNEAVIKSASLITLKGSVLRVAATEKWAPVGFADVTGDNVPDIVWRSGVTDQIAYWSLAGDMTAAFVGGDFVKDAAGANFKTGEASKGVKLADFDGDGKKDVLLSSGKVALLDRQANGKVVGKGMKTLAANLDSSFVIKSVGDFNNDGTADLAWESSTSDRQLLEYSKPETNGFDLTASTVRNLLPTGTPQAWNIVASKDFSSDGTSDLLWYNNATGELAVWAIDPRTGGLVTKGNVTSFLTYKGANLKISSDWEVVGTDEFGSVTFD